MARVEGAQEIQMEPGGCHLHQDGPEETGEWIWRWREPGEDVGRTSSLGLPESPSAESVKEG